MLYISCILAESAVASFVISHSGAGRYQNPEWCSSDQFLSKRPKKRQVIAVAQMAVEASIIIASFSHSVQPLCD
jgi:hypothetical protein